MTFFLAASADFEFRKFQNNSKVFQEQQFTLRSGIRILISLINELVSLAMVRVPSKFYHSCKKIPPSYITSNARRHGQLLAASISSRLVKAGKPELTSSLTPNYAVGCKRFLASDNYYETLAQDNVTVIPAGVDKIEGKKLWAGDSAFEVDILVLATGFEIQHPFGHLDIIGKNGISLKDLWKNEPPKTYKTVMMHGYPNFFHMLGPGAALGHNSVVAMIECQINFGIDCIKNMKRYQLDYIEPKKDAQEKFSSDLKNDLKSTVWLTGGCKSWYQNDNSGSVNLWSGTVTSFWWNLRNPTIKDFIQGHESKKLV
ncbi:unnamed protein product [Absidia cylindrospora]